METQTETPQANFIEVDQKESCKLIKNSRGYGWELKIFVGLDDKAFIDRLLLLNNQLALNFGSGTITGIE